MTIAAGAWVRCLIHRAIRGQMSIRLGRALLVVQLAALSAVNWPTTIVWRGHCAIDRSQQAFREWRRALSALRRFYRPPIGMSRPRFMLGSSLFQMGGSRPA